MAHLPFVGRSPFCQTANAADVRPDTFASAKLARSVHTVVGWSRATAMMGPPKNGGGHGSQRTISKRYSHYANGTASRPQGSPFRATGAFSRGKGEAASGGPGRAGAVSTRAVGEGRIASGAMKPLTICGRNRRKDAAE